MPPFNVSVLSVILFIRNTTKTIYNATNIQMDFNGDGLGGADNSDQEFDAINDQEAEQVSGNVNGFGGISDK